MNRINKNVRYLRESVNQTKTWVAERVDRSSTIISNYESGKVTPPVEMIMKYAEIFGVKASDIIDRDLEAEGPSESVVSEPPLQYGVSRLQREKDLLHREIDLKVEEIKLLHQAIRRDPAALAELKALDPDLYEALEKQFPSGDPNKNV